MTIPTSCACACSVAGRDYHSRRLRQLTGIEAGEGQSAILLNDLTAWAGMGWAGSWDAKEGSSGRVLTHLDGARWMLEIFEPVVAQLVEALGEDIDPVQAYCDLLEVRWLLSEQAGHDVGNAATLASMAAHKAPTGSSARMAAVEVSPSRSVPPSLGAWAGIAHDSAGAGGRPHRPAHRRRHAVPRSSAALDGGAVRLALRPAAGAARAPARVADGPPDFVIIGAQKSGTTWWQGLVEGHLQVVRPGGQRRELHYFDHFWDRWPSDEQFERYERYFPRPEGSLVGEKTPGYLYQPWVAPMLAQVAPEARLIVLMRDPVERYVSGLGLLATLGRHAGAGGGGRRGHARASHRRGHGARPLRRPAGLVAASTSRASASCSSSTSAAWPTHRASSRGPSSSWACPTSAPRRPRSRGRARRPPATWSSRDAMRRFLADYYAADVARLRELMPDLDVSLWPSQRR